MDLTDRKKNSNYKRLDGSIILKTLNHFQFSQLMMNFISVQFTKTQLGLTEYEKNTSTVVYSSLIGKVPSNLHWIIWYLNFPEECKVMNHKFYPCLILALTINLFLSLFCIFVSLIIKYANFKILQQTAWFTAAGRF